MLPITPVHSERRTSHTLAGALAASTRNTPGPDGGCAARCSPAIWRLRSPALQETTGTPLAWPHALTRRAARAPLRLTARLCPAPAAALRPRRHHVREPRTVW